MAKDGDAADREMRYLASDGDDSADGKTPSTAWRTIDKLNSSSPPGATIRLRRGDVFYGGLVLKPGIDKAHPTILADWGEGPKPVISAAKILKSDQSIWQDRSHCFWRTDLANPANYSGLVTDDCNPGFLMVDGVVKPWKRFYCYDLVSPWDFSAEDGWLWVHSPKNPALMAKDIRVAMNSHCVHFSSYTQIENISVHATGAHGMVGGWSSDELVEGVRISNCDFVNIGGSELKNYDTKNGFRIRYGNGIEFGSNCRDAIIDGCSFEGVYDTAFTMQGRPNLTSWQDIHVRNCTMTDCTQAFEIWCAKAPSGIGFERCSFTGNRTLRVGGGWGAVSRPCRRVSTPLLIYAMETDTVDIDVSGNTFEDVPYGLVYHNGISAVDHPGLPPGYRIHDNELVNVRTIEIA